MGSKASSSASPTNFNQSMKLGICHQIPHFPEEIIFQILSRLPVKSVLRFKCVSKSWLSLISCPRFIKTHLEISTKDPRFSKHQILFAIQSRPWDLKQCTVNSLIFEPCAADLFDIIYPMEFHERAFWVVGSCNGLICFRAPEMLYLWNPATRMSTKLPSINTKILHIESCGFGYVESADDYRVVVILDKYDEDGNYESSQMHIYSLKTGSWKRVDDFKGGYPESAYGVFASGKLHFSMESETDLVSRWDIISIDLETEVNGIIEKPNCQEGSYELDLGVLGGCICIVSNNQNVRVDLWVLKEYGVKEAWTKMFAIPYISKPWGPLLLRPVFVLPNDRVVMILAKGLGVYSVKDNSLRCFEIRPHPYGSAGIYVESLVSPTSK